jgi:hypothetical protein
LVLFLEFGRDPGGGGSFNKIGGGGRLVIEYLFNNFGLWLIILASSSVSSKTPDFLSPEGLVPELSVLSPNLLNLSIPEPVVFKFAIKRSLFSISLYIKFVQCF